MSQSYSATSTNLHAMDSLPPLPPSPTESRMSEKVVTDHDDVRNVSTKTNVIDLREGSEDGKEPDVDMTDDDDEVEFVSERKAPEKQAKIREYGQDDNLYDADDDSGPSVGVVKMEREDVDSAGDDTESNSCSEDKSEYKGKRGSLKDKSEQIDDESDDELSSNVEDDSDSGSNSTEAGRSSTTNLWPQQETFNEEFHELFLWLSEVFSGRRTESQISAALIQAKYDANAAFDILRKEEVITIDDSELDFEEGDNHTLSPTQIDKIIALQEWFPHVEEQAVRAALAAASWDANQAALDLTPRTSEMMEWDSQRGESSSSQKWGVPRWKGKEKAIEIDLVGDVDSTVIFGNAVRSDDIEEVTQESTNIERDLGGDQIETEKWVRKYAADKHGFAVVLPSGEYHSRINSDLLDLIPAFQRCFMNEPGKLQSHTSLHVMKPVDARAFSMVLQWVSEHYFLLDDNRYQHGTEKLNQIMEFIHAAIILGVDLETKKASINKHLVDILDEDPLSLAPKHVKLVFEHLRNSEAAQPIRELFARSIVGEYFMWTPDPHDRWESHGDETPPVYDADAGPARRGISGRGFRWRLEMVIVPQLKQLFDACFFATFESREIVNKRQRMRPAGVYYIDPLTNKPRCWYTV